MEKKIVKINPTSLWPGAVRIRLLIIIILIIANASAIFMLTRPKPDYSYTGNYTAKVYEDGKLQKGQTNYLMVLNGDGNASLVLDGTATNGKWKVKDGILTIGGGLFKDGKELTEKESKTKGVNEFAYKESKTRTIVFAAKGE